MRRQGKWGDKERKSINLSQCTNATAAAVVVYPGPQPLLLLLHLLLLRPVHRNHPLTGLPEPVQVQETRRHRHLKWRRVQSREIFVHPPHTPNGHTPDAIVPVALGCAEVKWKIRRREGLEGNRTILGVRVDEEGEGKSEIGDKQKKPDPTGGEGLEGSSVIIVAVGCSSSSSRGRGRGTQGMDPPVSPIPYIVFSLVAMVEVVLPICPFTPAAVAAVPMLWRGRPRDVMIPAFNFCARCSSSCLIAVSFFVHGAVAGKTWMWLLLL